MKVVSLQYRNKVIARELATLIRAENIGFTPWRILQRLKRGFQMGQCRFGYRRILLAVGAFNPVCPIWLAH